MTFDWPSFWQQTVNQLWAAIVMVPIVVVAFALLYWLKGRR